MKTVLIHKLTRQDLWKLAENRLKTGFKKYGRDNYKNDNMLDAYETEKKKHPPDRSKEIRRDVAKRRASEPHWQGTLPYTNR